MTELGDRRAVLILDRVSLVNRPAAGRLFSGAEPEYDAGRHDEFAGGTGRQDPPALDLQRAHRDHNE
jgi:hypothetical protein